MIALKVIAFTVIILILGYVFAMIISDNHEH
jgi:hypothetical protein